MKIFYLLTLFTFLLFSCQDQSTATSETKNTKAKEVSTSKTLNKDYISDGKKIAKASFMSMSGKLKKAMKSGGVKKALKYCNMEAMPITDSLSKVHNVTIKRTSLQLRNPNNEPTAAELAQLNKYRDALAEGEKIKPTTLDMDAHTTKFYAPITIKKACLACHGDLTEEKSNMIKSYYPADKATGYKEGDLRGMWSIEFKK